MSAFDIALRQIDALILSAEASAGPALQPKAAPPQKNDEAGEAEAVRPEAPETPVAKAKKAPKEAAKKPVAEEKDIITKAKLQVGKLVSVEDIDSDKLYKCVVEVEGGEKKQVIAGLKQFMTKDSLLGRLVVVILNLKPAKLAGELSEAMVLAADAPDPSGEGLIVRPLDPPVGSLPGDPVYVDGEEPMSEFPKVLKSDPWKKIVGALSVKESRACYNGKHFKTALGPISLPPEVPEGAGIH